MIITVTLIKLKSPFSFFALSLNALRILRQLRENKACMKYKSTGFWTMHYTLSLWSDASEMKKFSRSGAHLEAMKISNTLAKEIRTYSYEGTTLPDWKEAKEKLINAKTLSFG